MSSRHVVTVQRTIPAPAEKIFNLLANPYEHHRLDGSGTVLQPKPGTPTRLFLGARFAMDMHHKFSYFTNNRVVAFRENEEIAWHHFARFVWRYQLTPVAGGTLVTESFDYGRPWGFVIVPLGWPERNRVAMDATLERLEKILTEPTATS